MDMDSSERYQLNTLVDYVIQIGLQNFLLQLKSNWLKYFPNEDNFYFHQLYTKLTIHEQGSVDTKDISTWDVTLCSKWILCFPWTNSLTQDEKNSIRALREIRNEIRHNNYRYTYLEYVQKVKDNLLSLKMLTDGLESEIGRIDNILVLPKESLENAWNYRTNRVIGGGSFGVVLDVNSKTDEKRSALKLILTDYMRDSANKEAKMLVKCSNHRNVVQYITSGNFTLTVEGLKRILQWETEVKKNNLNSETKKNIRDAFYQAVDSGSKIITGLFLSMELCGENLRDWLNYCSSANIYSNEIILHKTRKRLSSELIDGLNYIHSKKVIHRDLRPPNIFFAQPNFVEPIKIGDFGLSKKVQLYVTKTGTRLQHDYCAPEIFQPDEDENVHYSQSLDYFALGLIIAEIFDPVKEGLVKKNCIEVTKRKFGVNLKKDRFFEELVEKLTSESPEDRYTTIGSSNLRVPIPREQIEVSIENTISSVTGIEEENYVCENDETNSESGADTPTDTTFNTIKSMGALSVNSSGMSQATGPNLDTPVESDSGQIDNFQLPYRNPSDHGGLTNEPPAGIQGPATVQYAGIPDAPPAQYARIPNAPPAQNARIPDAELTRIRKLLQGNKSFWNSSCVSEFLTKVSGVQVPESEFSASPDTKPFTSAFNRNFYKCREVPNLKQTVASILHQMGWQDLADAVRSG